MEVLLGFVAIGMRKSTAGALLAFAVCLMMFWKTVAYMGSDLVAGFPHTAHNDMGTFLSLYVVPSGFWLVVPALAMVRLWGTLTAPAAGAKGGKSA